MTNDNRSVDDINNDEAPVTSSFHYNGKLMVEEWTYLSLEKRTRGAYIKADVPYYHVAVQPLSYRITDGGQEGDNLEHTYVTMKTTQGELTPKGSGRDELVQAFSKLGFKRSTKSDLDTNSAIGKVFKFKRYNRTYTNRQPGGDPIRGELMNVPVDILPNDWAPEPGVEVPVYPRAPRNQTSGSASSMASGSVAKPVGVSMETVATALATASVSGTESAVRTFVLDRADLAQGEVLDKALSQELLAALVDGGFAKVTDGKVTIS